MSSQVLTYKGFLGSVEVEFGEQNIMHGKLLFVNDLVTYEAENPTDLQKAFQDAVEDYIETCKLVGKEPEKPFKGSLNIRLGPELHKDAATYAAINRISINDLVKNAIEEKLSTSKVLLHKHEHVVK
ncbi:MAG: HicB family protein [uncultured bacterium]|nr:MAG: HicB family protein [uncultured bacterium]